MRLIGWLLVTAGAAALAYNVWTGLGGGEELRLWEFGELLFRLFGANASVGFQGFFENRVSPDFWANWIDPWVNRRPAFLVLAVPGVVLIVLSALWRALKRARR